MNRKFLIIASVAVSFVGVSCEKHSWEDVVKIEKEIIRDENGEIVETFDTEVVSEKGAKRFFIEESHGGHDSHGDQSKDTKKADSSGH